MTRQPRVTICVPVYNGRAFVEETLESIQRQRYKHWTVLISDDRSDDRSADLCRRFTRDPRFSLCVQPARLGWVENCNWLLRHAGGELASVVSHDDLLEPDHIAQLVSCLASEDRCALAFTDVRVVGLVNRVEHQSSIHGTAVERVRSFIANHFDGTAFHGVIRRGALQAVGGLRPNDMNGFAADVSWLARLAQAGEFRRVAEPLYLKRRHGASASMQWGNWGDEIKASAWALHCRELLRDGLALEQTADDRRLLVRAVLRRLFAIEPSYPFVFLAGWPPERRTELVAQVLADVQSSPDASMRSLAHESLDAIRSHLTA